MTAAAVEVVIGVIPSAKTKTGMFSAAAYTLVVTSYRPTTRTARRRT
jgi:hypothetical protein